MKNATVHGMISPKVVVFKLTIKNTGKTQERNVYIQVNI